MTTSAFQSASVYPELLPVIDRLPCIYREAILSNKNRVRVTDSRMHSNAWHVLPLKVEAEDATVMSDGLCQANQRLAPDTCNLLSAIPTIKAYAFSILQPTGHILPHSHENPFVTAMLCLKDGGNAFIRVNGESKYFKEGELIIFDYTKTHEVINNGLHDRMVLLMLLENRLHQKTNVN
jgi:aspartyl/asparaginyl beta-hydroxylase (cupin superfamily)